MTYIEVIAHCQIISLSTTNKASMDDDRSSSSPDKSLLIPPFVSSPLPLLPPRSKQQQPPPKVQICPGMGCAVRRASRSPGGKKRAHHTPLPGASNCFCPERHSRPSDATCNGWQGRGRRIGKCCLRKHQPRVRVEFSLPPWGEETVSFLL